MNHLSGIDDVINAASSSTPTPANIDSTWVLITSFSALLTILGFAFISSGAVRYKSVQSAVITVLLGAVITILFFWLVRNYKIKLISWAMDLHLEMTREINSLVLADSLELDTESMQQEMIIQI